MYYRIYSAAIAQELLKKGFKIVKVEPSEKCPGYDTFLFEDTPQFRLAMWQARLTRKEK